MQNFSPLLSICIPTYNRSNYLKECLDSIINQEGFNEKEIEIVISDNASPDGTQDLVKKYQKKYSNIIYHRNEENLGAIRNLCDLPIYLAKGDYVWLFSDDDLMSLYGISKTISAIKGNVIDLLLSYRIDFVDGEKVETFIDNKRNPQIFNGLYEFSNFISTDIKEYSRRYAELFTFISTICFRKSLFQENFRKAKSQFSKKYMDYIYNKHYFGFQVILYGFLNQDITIGIYQDTLTYCRTGTQAWDMGFRIVKDVSDVFMKFYINHKKINKRVLITFFRIITSWIFPAIVGTIKPYINKKVFEFMKKMYLKINGK